MKELNKEELEKTLRDIWYKPLPNNIPPPDQWIQNLGEYGWKIWTGRGWMHTNDAGMEMVNKAIKEEALKYGKI